MQTEAQARPTVAGNAVPAGGAGAPRFLVGLVAIVFGLSVA